MSVLVDCVNNDLADIDRTWKNEKNFIDHFFCFSNLTFYVYFLFAYFALRENISFIN